MIDAVINFFSSHATLAALIYSWGSFEIGRMYYGMKRRTGTFLWCILGIGAAVVYAIAGCFLRQWIGSILLALTIVLQVKFARRWFNSLPQSPGESR
jgi:hypothetical protein